MEKTKMQLQKLMDKQRKKSEQYIQTVQKVNKLKAESYSLHIKVNECREQLMAKQLLTLYKKKLKEHEGDL